MQTTIWFFLSFFVEAIVSWQYASKIRCEDSISKKMSMLLLTALYVVLFSISLYEIRWLNTFLYFVFNAFYLFIILQGKLRATLFHAAVLTALMCVTELIAYGVISYFHSSFFEKSMYFYRLAFFFIISKLLFFLSAQIIIRVIGGKSYVSRQYDKTALILCTIPLTTCIIMITFVNIGANDLIDTKTAIMLAISGVLLLGINILIFGMNEYNQNKSAELLETQLQLQKEADSAKYYSMLLQAHESQSILVHDIKNHLQSILMLNETHETEKISQYINHILNSDDLKEFTRSSDNNLLNAIISKYQRQCNDAGVSFHADIRNHTLDFVRDEDITTIFCNLLDNAIESAQNIPDAYIDLNITRRENTPFIIFTLVNSCRSNPFLDKNTNILITRKADKSKHGFGLKSIRNAIRKYDGEMKTYYDECNSEFHTVISVRDK